VTLVFAKEINCKLRFFQADQMANSDLELVNFNLKTSFARHQNHIK